MHVEQVADAVSPGENEDGGDGDGLGVKGYGDGAADEVVDGADAREGFEVLFAFDGFHEWREKAEPSLLVGE